MKHVVGKILGEEEEVEKGKVRKDVVRHTTFITKETFYCSADLRQCPLVLLAKVGRKQGRP
jgi:hypothetical protein